MIMYLMTDLMWHIRSGQIAFIVGTTCFEFVWIVAWLLHRVKCVLFLNLCSPKYLRTAPSHYMPLWVINAQMQLGLVSVCAATAGVWSARARNIPTESSRPLDKDYFFIHLFIGHTLSRRASCLSQIDTRRHSHERPRTPLNRLRLH